MPVRVSVAARADIDRLTDFLLEYSEAVSDRAIDTLAEAMEGLGVYPERGVREHKDIRRLPVRFGQSGYTIHYRFDGREVLITRIRHMREQFDDC